MHVRYKITLIVCVLLGTVFSLPRPGYSQWVKEASIPSPPADAALAFGIGAKAYFGGGTTFSKAFYEYDQATNTWTRKADLPIGKTYRAFGTSFSIGSKGYVAFGQSDTSGQGSVTNDLWEYDPATDKWTKKADLPGAARDGAMAFTIGNKAYVGGGVGADFFYLGDFYSYDPSNDTWTQLNDLPSGAIGFPMAFTVGNKGYLVGGVASSELKTAYAYDPTQDSWTSVAPYPGSARQAGAGFAIDTLGYVGLGAANQYSVMFSDFYSYNPATNKWQAVADKSPYTLGLGWPATAVVGHTAYVGGGADKNFNYYNAWSGYTPPGAASVIPKDSLISPADMSTISAPNTTFQWQAITDKSMYHLEISSSPSFETPTTDTVVQGTASATIPTNVPGQYYWRVAIVTGSEAGPWSSVRSFTVASATVAPQVHAPTGLLLQESPNPFVGTATIEVQIPHTETVTLRVVDVLGRLMGTVYSGQLEQGTHTFQWNAAGAAMGSYYLQAASSEGTTVERIEVTR